MLDVRDLRMRYGTTDVLTGVNFTAHPGEVVALLGPERRRQDDHHRDPRGVPDALGRARSRAGRGSGARGRELAGAARGGAAVVARPRQVAGPRAARAPRAVLRAVLDGPHHAGRGTPTSWSRPSGSPSTRDKKITKLSGGSAAGWTWRSASSGGRSCCSSTSRPPASTRRRGASSTTWCTGSPTQDTTILLTTHDLDEAEKLADRILILAGGTIIADGSADELARRMSTEAEVKWTVDGQRFVHSTQD